MVAIFLPLGLAGAHTVARLLTGLLYEIGPWDVGTYLGTIAVLGSAAALATLVPAIRATTIASDRFTAGVAESAKGAARQSQALF